MLGIDDRPYPPIAIFPQIEAILHHQTIWYRNGHRVRSTRSQLLRIATNDVDEMSHTTQSGYVHTVLASIGTIARDWHTSGR